MDDTKIYALYWRGEILDTKRYKQFILDNKYYTRTNWREPKYSKKVYYTIGHAKIAIKQLKKEIQHEIEIVEFEPTKVVYPEERVC